MSRRPYDPFAPLVTPDTVRDVHAEVSLVDDDEEVTTPVDLTPDPEPLTGDAALRVEEPTPIPEPEPPVKATKPRRARRTRKTQPAGLEEALARLDETT